MAHVSSDFRRAWRSKRYVGADRAVQKVLIRRGHFNRGYHPWFGYDVHAKMPGRSETSPWQATWHPDEEFREVPNVSEVNLEQDFTNNGITNATIQVDNVAYEAVTGIAGTFHRILRGFLAPMRGWRAKRRPKQEVEQNEWFRYLDRINQITVLQGYGDELVETYSGLTDKIDLRSAPDQVTITARDFGQTLTDQQNIGRARDKAIGGNPTVFAPMKEFDPPYEKKHKSKLLEYVGSTSNHDCSSYHRAHTPRFIVVRSFVDSERFWQSAHKPGPDEGGHGKDNTEWVQVHLPRGRYESFFIEPAYAGMEMWVSVKANRKNVSHGGRCTVDGDEVDDGWIDVGRGVVPGETDGGEPWLIHYNHLGLGRHEIPLKHSLVLGDGSLLRVSFRNLRELRYDGKKRYAAGVRTLFGIKLKHRTVHRTKHTKQGVNDNVVYVRDVADMVKVALRWAGFKEWNIESTGMKLPQRLTFHNGDTLMSIIQKAQEMTGYTFFIGDPSGNEDEASIGVPVFRQPRVLTYSGRVEEIRETDLLTGVEVKWDREALRDPIYIRGKATKTWRKGGKGRNYGEDHTARVQALYRPPWSDNRSGGLLRHFVQHYNHLRTQRECKVAAQMVAVNMALQSLTAIIELPGNPAITLDSYVGVVDTGTGMNTRMYVSNRSSRFQSGQETAWEMTLGGALIDAPDLHEALADLWKTLAHREERHANNEHYRPPRTANDETHRPHRGRQQERQHRHGRAEPIGVEN